VLHPTKGQAPPEDREHADAGHGDGHSSGDRRNHQDGRDKEIVGHPEEQHKERAGAGDDADGESEPGTCSLLLSLERRAREAIVMCVMVIMPGVGVLGFA
jgi:hypothetical protein